MKKHLLYLFMILLITVFSCDDDDESPNEPALKTVTVQLVYPENSVFGPVANTEVKMSSGTTVFTEKTDEAGKVTFTVPVGIYEVSATDNGRSAAGKLYLYNGLTSNVTITDGWLATDVVKVNLTESLSNQIVIKEVFVGGTPKDDGSGTFLYDRYVTLYNNSATAANLGNMCLATTAPYTAQSSNNYYDANGKLLYEAEGWIPAGQGIWYFQQNVTIEPGKQIVVAIANAVNNTITYSNSINFDKAEYYCTYDPEKFTHAATYPAPAASIPTSHYLKAEAYGAGIAWTLSNTSPGFFIFETEGTTPVAFAGDASLTHTQGAFVSKKVPVEWIVDGVESYLLNNANNKKRFTANVDAGYVYHLNNQGYSIYRNVDKTATEALPENAGKLVYNYAFGTTAIGGTTDASGIDAEASIKNGARIIYMDTNNSTNDFHLRSQASLRN